MDRLLGRRWPVLDDGFIRVIDYMGNDAAIVQAARISYGVGTKSARSDVGLIRYLLSHNHTTPFEMCEVKLHVRVPMDTWRQWIRHRTANVNEYSTRYSLAIDSAARTASTDWRRQSEINRQSSAGVLSPAAGKRLSKGELALQRYAQHVYRSRIKAGVAREQARKDLPLSTFTEAYWKIDLHNLLRFLELRMAADAQQEIREYATVIGQEIVARWCPATWKAFEDFRLNEMALSRTEQELIHCLSRGDIRGAVNVARAAGFLPKHGKVAIRGGERREVEKKLQLLGFVVPWTADGQVPIWKKATATPARRRATKL
jgi:thymidylate synthase (FAD)